MDYREARTLNGEIYSLMLKCAAGELRAHIKDVNELNVFPVPDGDTGDNMWRTINGGVKALRACKTEGLVDAVNTSSKGMLLEARGNSGVILSQFFKGITDVLNSAEAADSGKILIALQNGVKHSYASVLKPTEGTILTVARESVEYASEKAQSDAKLSVLFNDLLTGMRSSLEHTPELLPVLKQAGVIDSGGAGLYYIALGFARAFTESTEALAARYGFKAEMVDNDAAPRTHADDVNVDLFTADDVMQYGYCTELLVRLQRTKTDIDCFDDEAVKQFLSSKGDSVVYFRDGSLVKLHVHTLDPEAVMTYMHQFGEFLKLKIENMTLEHTDNDAAATVSATGNNISAQTAKASVNQNKFTPSGNAEAAENAFDPAFCAPIKTADKKLYGTVAVCAGRGFTETFQALGLDAAVAGGQSLNPSAQDFIDAFKTVNAEHIIVFPNNKNIFLSARQAAGLYPDAKIHIIETTNLGQGYAGLSAMYPDETDIDVLLEAVNAAVGSTASGSVSVAVKNGNFNGIAVSAGDYIGFVDKKIISSESDPVSAATLLADKLMADGAEVLTCFTGKDTTPQMNALLEKIIANTHPDAEVFFTHGDQDVFNYIFVTG